MNRKTPRVKNQLPVNLDDSARPPYLSAGQDTWAYPNNDKDQTKG